MGEVFAAATRVAVIGGLRLGPQRLPVAAAYYRSPGLPAARGSACRRLSGAPRERAARVDARQDAGHVQDRAARDRLSQPHHNALSFTTCRDGSVQRTWHGTVGFPPHHKHGKGARTPEYSPSQDGHRDHNSSDFWLRSKTQVLRLTCREPGYEDVMVVPLGGYEAADSCGRQVAAVISAAATVDAGLCRLVA